MKRIKSMNGYAIYQAGSRDVDKYGVEDGAFYVYFSSDIRDFGISNSEPEFEGLDTLEAAESCCTGNYAKAREIVEGRTTAASFEEIAEVEAQLDAGTIDEDGESIDHRLDHSKIGFMPHDLHAILKVLGIRYTTFSAAEAHGVKLEGTNDGYTIARHTPGGVQYMIVYNDTVAEPQRIRWTIAHEIGHIVLGHLDGRVVATNLEAKADAFACALLCLRPVFNATGARPPQTRDLHLRVKHFRVTEELKAGGGRS